jgi:DNA-binding transcriptional ArsR family regulator
MVEHQSQLDAVFHALSDPSRRAILTALRSGERSVGELAQPLPMTLAGASKHIGVLERAGLVRRRASGRAQICSLHPQAMRAAHDWLGFYERFWSERLDALEQALAEDGDKR